MSWEVPTAEDCPYCGKTMFKKSGKGQKKVFCINEECENFTPEELRGGYRKKKTTEEPEETKAEAKTEAETTEKKTKKTAEKKTAAKKTTAKKTTKKAAATKKTAAKKTTAKKTTAKKTTKAAKTTEEPTHEA